MSKVLLEVLTDVLSLPIKKLQVSSLPEEILKIVNAFKLPKISGSDVKRLTKMKEGNKIMEALGELKYEFPYSEDLLLKLPSLESQDEEILDYLSVLALYSFIAWIKESREHDQMIPPGILLKALLGVQRRQTLVNQAILVIFEIVVLSNSSDMCYDILNEYLEYVKRVQHEDLLVGIIHKLTTVLSEKKFSQFLINLGEELKIQKWILSDKSLDVITAALRDLLYRGNSAAFGFLGIATVSEKNAKTILEFIPFSLLEKLKKSKPLTLPITDVVIASYPMSSVPKTVLDFPVGEVSPDEFDPSFSVAFPEMVDLAQFFDQDVQTLISTIVEFLKVDGKRVSILVNEMFLLLDKMTSDAHFYSLFGAMLLIMNDMLHTQGGLKLSAATARKFIHSSVFHPSVTVFSEGVEFSVVNTIRAICLDCCLSDSGEAINNALKLTLAAHPLVLAETLLRLTNIPTVFAEKIRCDRRIVKTLISIAKFYQCLDLSGSNDTKSIRISRSAQFAILGHLFSDPAIVEFFFGDVLFQHSFCSFLFEKPVRPFVIEILTNFLTVTDLCSVEYMIEVFLQIVKIIDLQLPGSEQMILLFDIISCLSASFAYHQKGISQWSGVCLVICRCMAKLSTDELSRSVFEKTVSFMALMSPYITITPLEINALISGLLAFHDATFVASLYKKFIAMLAGHYVASSTPNFIIKQPQVLKLFIQTLFDTPKLKEILEFIIRLCKYSPRNLDECAKSDLDMFVVEYLERVKQSESLSTDIMKLFLELYGLLSIPRSTAQCVLRYISLMAPLDEKHVSKYQNLFIENLNQIVLDSCYEPMNSFSLNGAKLKFKVEDRIDFGNIRNGFTFAFWVYIEPNQFDYRPQICSLHLGKHMKIGLFMSNNSLLCFEFDGEKETTSMICDSMELSVWHFIEVTVNIGKIVMLHHSIDCGEKRSVSISPFMYEIVPSEASFSIGGRCVSSVEVPSRLGAFGLFPKMTPEKLISIFELGVRNNQTIPIDAIVYMSDYSSSEENCMQEPDGFVKVLVTQCGVNSVLPLLVQTEYSFKDGTEFSISLETFVTLLMNVLKYSRDGQFLFYQNKGFSVMAHLLASYWAKRFTWKAYMQLYNLLTSLNCEPLQQQLFDEIMTDFSFLMAISPEIHLRIVKHWARSLFSSFSTIAQNYSSFEDIMAVLRLFYWYNPVESIPIKYKDVRSEGLNVKECRKYLFMLLSQYAHEYFSHDHFECVIGHAISCGEEQQVCEILGFLREILCDLPESLLCNLECSCFTQLIRYYMRYPSETIKIRVLEILIAAHQMKSVSDEFFLNQIAIIIKVIPTSYITKSFLDWVVSVLPEEPMMFPLASIFAMELKNYEFVSKIEPRCAYAYGNSWAIYAIGMCLTVPDDHQKQILKFLMNVSKGHLCELYSQCDIVLQTFPELALHFDRVFLDVLCEFIDETMISTFAEAMDFFGICKRLICFIRKADNRKSPIELAYEETDEEDETVYGISVEYFFSKLTENKITEPKLVFSVSFDEQGNWMHMNLAKLYLRISSLFPSRQLLFFRIIMCAFLLRNGEDVSSEMSEILVSEASDVEIAQQCLNYSMSMLKDQKSSSRNPVITNPFLDEHKFPVIVAKCKSESYSTILTNAAHNLEHIRVEIYENTENRTSVDISKYIMFATRQMREFIDRQNLQNDVNFTTWRRLWLELSIERGPWHIPKVSTSKSDWRRDMCACYGWAPVKMIRATQALEMNIEGFANTKRGVLFSAKCCVVHLNERKSAEVELYETFVKITVGRKTFTIWYLSITGLFRKHNNGVHLFTVLGRSFHFEFQTKTDADYIIKNIDVICPRNQRLIMFQRTDARTYMNIVPLTQQWKNREISNYEYILMVNIICGRSFNDLSQYPVFPWVLKNYESEIDADTLSDFSSHTSTSEPLPPGVVTEYLRAIEPFASFATSESVMHSLQAYKDFSERVSCCVVPEFYSMPELFSDFTPEQLPKWAKTPLEFVYVHRKLLESDAISSQLHIWLDKTFGVENSSSPLYCFDDRHPQRISTDDSSKALKRMIEYRCDPPEFDKFSAVIVVEEKPLVFTIWFYESSGRLVNTSVNLRPSSATATLPQNLSGISSYQIFSPVSDNVNRIRSNGLLSKTGTSSRGIGELIPTTNIKAIKNLKHATHVCVSGHHIIVAVPEHPLYIIDSQTGKIREVDIGTVQVNDLDADGLWTVVGGNNATITIIRSYEMISTVRIFRDAVISCAVSSTFNLAVGGTRDSSLILCSTVTSSLLKVINLGRNETAGIVPEKILITPSWGFIVAYCTEIVAGELKHFIFVYTVNGQFVHKVEIDMPIDYWCCWRSKSGFDYIAYASDSGQVFFAEVFYLKDGAKYVCNCRCQIASVTYSSATLTIVTTLGQVTFYPLVL